MIVVTGGAGGIGLAIARVLLEQGHGVVLLDAEKESLDRAMASLGNLAAKAVCQGVDVTQREAVFAVAADIVRQHDAVTGLVTCAGITRTAAAHAMTEAQWRAVLSVNLDGTFFCCQAFGESMLARRNGSIVTISSVTGLGGQDGRANYAASKWGVIGLTKALAIEWGVAGVRVNCIAPGPIHTPLFDSLPASLREDVLLDRTPLGRAAEAEEVAKVARFLLSADASFINGAVMTVDGGFTAGFANSRRLNVVAASSAGDSK